MKLIVSNITHNLSCNSFFQVKRTNKHILQANNATELADLSVAAGPRKSTSTMPIDESLRKTVCIMAFEVCKSWQVFKRRATEIFNDLCALLPTLENIELQLSINKPPLVPRRGAFEISIYKQKPTEFENLQLTDSLLIWSGLKKGPPRKNKFPNPAEILTDVLNAINSTVKLN